MGEKLKLYLQIQGMKEGCNLRLEFQNTRNTLKEGKWHLHCRLHCSYGMDNIHVLHQNKPQANSSASKMYET